MKFLHVMLRIKNIQASVAFFAALGCVEVRRMESQPGRFTLVYLKPADSEVEIELTYNWDEVNGYADGKNFGHLAFQVENINDTCDELARLGGVVVRPPRDGYMAFVKTPDHISIELLQRGGAIVPSARYAQMPNQGSW